MLNKEFEKIKKKIIHLFSTVEHTREEFLEKRTKDISGSGGQMLVERACGIFSIVFAGVNGPLTAGEALLDQ
jgi:superoxide dismutase